MDRLIDNISTAYPIIVPAIIETPPSRLTDLAIFLGAVAAEKASSSSISMSSWLSLKRRNGEKYVSFQSICVARIGSSEDGREGTVI